MDEVLWIAEKKSLAEAVGKALGVAEFDWSAKGLTHNRIGKHSFVWLDGHAFEQAMPDHYLPDSVPRSSTTGKKIWREEDLPVIPQTWFLLPKAAKTQRLDKLEELLRKCDVVHHLGDPDEEGQLLVDEALGFFSNTKPVKRVLVNDYNETKVRQALANIRDNSEQMFRGWHLWALARSRYDWLLGLNATRAMTLRGRKLGFNGLLPVGSVQTPLLYIVRERDRVIENFKPVPFFTLTGHIDHTNGRFKAKWKPSSEQAGLDHDGRLLDQGIAQALATRLAGKPGTITAYSKTRKEQRPPLPLSMNELQIECFSRYGYTGQQVLDAGQRLYEVYKVATYPRSDNRYLSEAQHKEAPATLAAVFKIRSDLQGLAPELNSARKSDAFNDKKMVGTPHHGIVPTIPEVEVRLASWSEIERNVYDLIARSYLAQFAAPYEYMQTSVEATVDSETFVAAGRTPVSAGWKAVFAETDADAGQDEADDSGKQTLPAMEKGDAAKCAGVALNSRKTTPPERFDDKLLLEAMMNVYKYVPDGPSRKRLKDGDGIGTTATRAPMIEDLKTRNLLVPVKAGSRKLMTSEPARALIDALPMDVKDPAQAGIFKASLDSVSRGETSFEAFMAQTAEWTTSIVETARTLAMTLPLAEGAVTCPKCKSGQLRRKESEKGAYWFCSNWNNEPEKCDGRYQDVRGKALTTPISCPLCKTGSLRFKESEKGNFWFCSNWNATLKCEARLADKLGKPDMTPKPKCPACKIGELRSITGANGKFWGCSRYRDGCKASYPDKLGKPDTAPKPVYQCPKCKTGTLRSLTGQKGAFWGCGRYKEGCNASYPDKVGKPDLLARAK
jgi:DNA topoisomerase-3